MFRKLLVAAALSAIALSAPLGGTAEARTHPLGGHFGGHFVGHFHGRVVTHFHGRIVARAHPFVHARFAALRFGHFERFAHPGWRGGWSWHGGWWGRPGWGWGLGWWWHPRWWWRSAWWWYPGWYAYPTSHAAPAPVAYHPVHPAAAPACVCTCCK